MIDSDFDPIIPKLRRLITAIADMYNFGDKEEAVLRAARAVRAAAESDIGWCSTGSCSNASEVLAVILRNANIPYRVRHGNFKTQEAVFECTHREQCSPRDYLEPHTWIEIPELNNAIVDVTADQFNGDYGDFPKVWFPADKKHYRRWRF